MTCELCGRIQQGEWTLGDFFIFHQPQMLSICEACRQQFTRITGPVGVKAKYRLVLSVKFG